MYRGRLLSKALIGWPLEILFYKKDTLGLYKLLLIALSGDPLTQPVNDICLEYGHKHSFSLGAKYIS